MNYKNKLSLCLLLAYVWCIYMPTQAKAQTLMSLEDCIQKALSQNLQIKIAENSVKQTREKIRETKTSLLPQISATYNFNYNPNLPPTFLPGFIVGQPQQESVSAVLGLKQTQYFGVQANIQLFNPLLFIALKAAKSATELSTLQIEKTKEDIVFNVSATYYNLLTIYQQMDLLKSNIKSFETTIKTTEVLVNNDFAKKTDINRLLLQKKSLETQLSNTEVTENSLLNVLKNLLSINDNQVISIKKDLDNNTATIRNLDTTQVNKRTDFRLIDAQLNLKNLERQSIYRGYMPNVTAFVSYNSYAYNDDFDPFKRVEQKSFLVSAVGLTVSIPIFDGGQKASKIRQNNFDLQNLGLQKQMQQTQIKTEIDNAEKKYLVALASMNMQNENLALAKKTLEEVKTNYQNGLVSVNDIINAENDIQKIQTDYLVANVTLKIAVLDLKKAYGILLK